MDTLVEKMLPMGQYEYVDATFAAVDTNTVINYKQLKVEDPNSVRFMDVSQGAGRVYKPALVSWGSGYVILASTDVGTTRLLLFEERA
jgi:hypothetical protein